MAAVSEGISPSRLGPFPAASQASETPPALAIAIRIGRVGSLRPDKHRLRKVSDMPALRAKERTLSLPITSLRRATNASRLVSGDCDTGCDGSGSVTGFTQYVELYKLFLIFSAFPQAGICCLSGCPNPRHACAYHMLQMRSIERIVVLQCRASVQLTLTGPSNVSRDGGIEHQAESCC